MKLNRSIGFIGLTFIAVSGIIGSGWIFGPLLTITARSQRLYFKIITFMIILSVFFLFYWDNIRYSYYCCDILSDVFPGIDEFKRAKLHICNQSYLIRRKR